MEDFLRLLYEANKAFKTADHLTYVTYPLIQETKLLLAITENLYSAMVKGVEAVLEYDQLYKRISLLPREFQSKLEIFKTKSVKRYNIDGNYFRLINDLREIIVYHKKSPIEFTRRNKYVICLNDYRIKTLDLKKTKKDVVEVKGFIEKINSILKDGRIY